MFQQLFQQVFFFLFRCEFCNPLTNYTFIGKAGRTGCCPIRRNQLLFSLYFKGNMRIFLQQVAFLPDFCPVKNKTSWSSCMVNPKLTGTIYGYGSSCIASRNTSARSKICRISLQSVTSRSLLRIAIPPFFLAFFSCNPE